MLSNNFLDAVPNLIILFATIIVLGTAILMLNKRIHNIQKQLDTYLKANKKIQMELNATASGAVGLGQRFLMMEKQIKELRARHQDLVSFGNDDRYQKKTYKQASQLASMGATIEDLKHSCELSQGEAELLSHMSSMQTH